MNNLNGTTTIVDGSERYTLIYSGITDKGKTREINEDTFVIVPDKKVFAVADGVGGMAAGDLASKMLATGIMKKLTGQYRFIPTLLARFFGRSNYNDKIEQLIKQENLTIFNKSQELKRPMASTIVLSQFCGHELKLIHVGDSRAYIFRDQQLTQMTKDHSLVYELYLQGQLQYEAMQTHPRRNVITRAVGAKRTVVPETTTYSIKRGDSILLCSDGLTTMLADKEILNILTSKQIYLYDTTKLLVKRANDAGGKDNITVVLIRVE